MQVKNARKKLNLTLVPEISFYQIETEQCY